MPFTTERSREDISKLVETKLLEFKDEIPVGIWPVIRDRALAIIGGLPDKVDNIRTVRRLNKPVDTLVATYSNDVQVAPAIRRTVCAEVQLSLFEDYLSETIARIKEHFQQYSSRKKKWGIGSFQNWKGSDGVRWGVSFYGFWRTIEPEGDAIFRAKILPHVPEQWRDKYELKELHACPHEWSNLSDPAIAGILKPLKRRINPAKKQWGLCSIQSWLSKTGEQWGASFIKFWRGHVEAPGDEAFRARILPHFPPEWQAKYELQDPCPHKWAEISDPAIAGILNSLKRKIDPATQRWSLGSIVDWKSEDDEPWGKSFQGFWRDHVEAIGDEAFRARILPHLPPEWWENCKLKELHMCPYNWDTLLDEEIAGILKPLKRKIDPATQRWGLGSIMSWTGEDDEPWGKSFHHFWRIIEPKGDADFRAKILPHLPVEWRKNYKFRVRPS